MPTRTIPSVPLSEMADGQEADVFVLLTSMEQATTRDGKPYFRVAFRDAHREVNFPIWNDSAWANACRHEWSPGMFYKIRAVYRETNYGPQLDIHKIREVTQRDREEGFDELMCQPASRLPAEEMFDQLVTIARDEIECSALSGLAVDILTTHRDILLTLPAASRNHHAFVGGYLEHVLSVTRTCLYLAGKYSELYPDLKPPLSRDLILAGAILHDIGKVRELVQQPQGAVYTPEGELIGHVLQGRDIVREIATGHDLDPQTLLKLEHIIVSHQRLPEWGSPKPPMIPEALVVHYADDLDAKFQIFHETLRDDASEGSTTSTKNPLRQKIFRGPA